MALKDDLKKEASKNKYVKWGVIALGVALAVFLFASGRKDDATKLVTFVESLSESTELVGEDVSHTTE